MQIGGMGVSPLANGGRPWKREGMKGINGEGCGVFGYFGGEDILGSWWKERRKEKGKKKKEKNL